MNLNFYRKILVYFKYLLYLCSRFGKEYKVQNTEIIVPKG